MIPPYEIFRRNIVMLFLQINRVSPLEVIGSDYNIQKDMVIIKTTRKTYRVPCSTIDYLYRKEVSQ